MIVGPGVALGITSLWSSVGGEHGAEHFLHQMLGAGPGMKEDWLDVIGCPSCQHALHFDNGYTSSLVCQLCGNQYTIKNRTPVMVRQEDLEILTEFNRQYQRMRLKEGWRPFTAEQSLTLPFGRPSGYPTIYWEVRRQSYSRLRKLLSEQGPLPSMGPVADLGAGNSWLSYRLAKSGYRVVAVESNLEEPFGLGAADIYLAHTSFLVVQGDLNQPPLQAGKFSLVLFNASLHYAKHLASALRGTVQALHPKGRLVILDSPITRKPRLGSGIGDRHFGRRELHDAIVAAGLRPHWITVRRGPRWWVAQVLRRARGKQPFSLPMIVAEKA